MGKFIHIRAGVNLNGTVADAKTLANYITLKKLIPLDLLQKHGIQNIILSDERVEFGRPIIHVMVSYDAGSIADDLIGAGHSVGALRKEQLWYNLINKVFNEVFHFDDNGIEFYYPIFAEASEAVREYYKDVVFIPMYPGGTFSFYFLKKKTKSLLSDFDELQSDVAKLLTIYEDAVRSKNPDARVKVNFYALDRDDYKGAVVKVSKLGLGVFSDSDSIPVNFSAEHGFIVSGRIISPAPDKDSGYTSLFILDSSGRLKDVADVDKLKNIYILSGVPEKSTEGFGMFIVYTLIGFATLSAVTVLLSHVFKYISLDYKFYYDHWDMYKYKVYTLSEFKSHLKEITERTQDDDNPFRSNLFFSHTFWLVLGGLFVVGVLWFFLSKVKIISVKRGDKRAGRNSEKRKAADQQSAESESAGVETNDESK